jgi:hypothetical protein
LPPMASADAVNHRLTIRCRGSAQCCPHGIIVASEYVSDNCIISAQI